MTFEQWLMERGLQTLQLHSLKAEDGSSIQMTDSSTISRWVVEESYIITAVGSSKKVVADEMQKVKDRTLDLPSHNYILSVEINAATSAYESGRWIYQTTFTIRRRTLDDWTEVE